MPFESRRGGTADEPVDSMPWCVDHGGWLEAMSTVSLWRALEMGEIPQETRVWREGLECWTPASEVRALCWTVSSWPPCDAAPAASVEGDGPESTGPLSFALTPEDLRTVAPRFHLGDPRSTQDQRSSAVTLAPSTSVPPPRAHDDRDPAGSPPISLELSPSFPAVPRSFPAIPSSSMPDTLPSAAMSPPSAARAAAPRAAPGPSRGAEAAPRGRASGVLARIARRPRGPRDALAIGAGSAVVAIVLGVAALSALPSPDAPAPDAPAPAPAAHLGLARRAAATAAQVGRPRPAAAAAPTETSRVAAPPAAPLAATESPLATAEPSLAAAGAPLNAAETPLATAGAPVHAAEIPLAAAGAPLATTGAPLAAAGAPLTADGAPLAADAPEDVVTSPTEGAATERAASAPPPGARPAPLGRRERGQVRLRRGRSDAEAPRGAHRYTPARSLGGRVTTGAIERDSR